MVMLSIYNEHLHEIASNTKNIKALKSCIISSKIRNDMKYMH